MSAHPLHIPNPYPCGGIFFFLISIWPVRAVLSNAHIHAHIHKTLRQLTEVFWWPDQECKWQGIFHALDILHMFWNALCPLAIELIHIQPKTKA